MSDERQLAPRSASPQYVVDAINRAVKLKPCDKFYDLGCGGDARIVIAMAKQAAEQLHRQQNEDGGAVCSAQPCNDVPIPAAATTTAATAVQEGTQAGQLLPASVIPPAEGEVLREHAPALPRFVGVELDSEAVIKATAAVAALPPDVGSTIQIMQGNLLQVPLHDATVVYVYLLPKGLSLLANKVKDEARLGCIILSYMFKVPGWEEQLQDCLPVTSGRADRPDVSGVSKLYAYCLSKHDASNC